jgi:hypothetical protein
MLETSVTSYLFCSNPRAVILGIILRDSLGAILRVRAKVDTRLGLRSFQKLLVVRRCVPERIVEATPIPLRGVHKSVEIFLDIDRFKQEAFVPNRLGVFDQNSCGTIDSPHPKSRP